MADLLRGPEPTPGRVERIHDNLTALVGRVPDKLEVRCCLPLDMTVFYTSEQAARKLAALKPFGATPIVEFDPPTNPEEKAMFRVIFSPK